MRFGGRRSSSGQVITASLREAGEGGRNGSQKSARYHERARPLLRVAVAHPAPLIEDAFGRAGAVAGSDALPYGSDTKPGECLWSEALLGDVMKQPPFSRVSAIEGRWLSVPCADDSNPDRCVIGPWWWNVAGRLSAPVASTARSGPKD